METEIGLHGSQFVSATGCRPVEFAQLGRRLSFVRPSPPISDAGPAKNSVHDELPVEGSSVIVGDTGADAAGAAAATLTADSGDGAAGGAVGAAVGGTGPQTSVLGGTAGVESFRHDASVSFGKGAGKVDVPTRT